MLSMVYSLRASLNQRVYQTHTHTHTPQKPQEYIVAWLNSVSTSTGEGGFVCTAG